MEQGFEHDIAARVMQAREQHHVVRPVQLADAVVLDPGHPIDRIGNAKILGQAAPGSFLGALAQHRQAGIETLPAGLGKGAQAQMHAFPVDEPAGIEQAQRRARLLARPARPWLRLGPDLHLDRDLVMAAPRQRLLGLLRLDVDHQSIGAGLTGDRIEPDQDRMQVAHQILQPAAPGQALAQRIGRPLAAAQRPEDQGRCQAAEQRRVANAAIGQMVDDVELADIQPLLDMAIEQQLPHEMGEMPGQAGIAGGHTFGLEAIQPARHEELEAQGRRQVALGQLRFDFRLQLDLGQHQDIVALARRLDRPIPAQSTFRPLIRGAGESAEQDLHRGMRPSGAYGVATPCRAAALPGQSADRTP